MTPHRLSNNVLALMLFPIASTVVGCAPTISVEVLQPALVSVDPEIQTIAIIDRSKPGNVGEHILGTLEGAVTGESVLGDREGAKKAIESMVMTLENSPRFDTVIPSVNDNQSETGLFADTMSWEAARKIAKKTDADAILALEAFDSDSVITWTTDTETETDDDGKEVTRTYHVAERDTTVLAAWRLYDVDDKVIIDDFRDRSYSSSWTSRGTSQEVALQALISQTDSIMAVGTNLGVDYARRISPTYVWVSRYYYGKGSPELKQGKHHVRAHDWEGAAEIWRGVIKSSSGKEKGKAQFNMALYHETQGDLEKALEFAQDAAVNLHNGKARSYVWILEQRIRDQKKLEEQLAAPPPEEEKPAGRATGTSSAERTQDHSTRESGGVRTTDTVPPATGSGSTSRPADDDEEEETEESGAPSRPTGSRSRPQ